MDKIYAPITTSRQHDHSITENELTFQAVYMRAESMITDLLIAKTLLTQDVCQSFVTFQKYVHPHSTCYDLAMVYVNRLVSLGYHDVYSKLFLEFWNFADRMRGQHEKWNDPEQRKASAVFLNATGAFQTIVNSVSLFLNTVESLIHYNPSHL